MTEYNPRGGAERVDQGRDEDALLHVGDGPEGAAALPLLAAGVAAGGNGHDGLAVVGPDAPVAPADPDLIALVQLLVPSNQAIAIRLTCVENHQVKQTAAKAAAAEAAAAATATVWRTRGGSVHRWSEDEREAGG